jgi:hypothetical protein
MLTLRVQYVLRIVSHFIPVLCNMRENDVINIEFNERLFQKPTLPQSISDKMMRKLVF